GRGLLLPARIERVCRHPRGRHRQVGRRVLFKHGRDDAPVLVLGPATAYTRLLNAVLDELLRTGRCLDAAGRERGITGAVTRADALILQQMVRFTRARTTLETGVAFGLSTLAICDALAQVGPGWKHCGVDPEQTSVHGGAALASLKRAGLDSGFELLEGPSHLMLPKLLERGVVLDLAFIDGWHTFDYTLLDFFYIDKLLRPGGIVLLHDISWPSKRKVLRFILTHRRYQRIPLRAPTRPGFWRRLRRIAAAKWHWVRGGPFGPVRLAFLNRPDLVALQKLEQFEPGHRFYRHF
ncbi:class I SAM-dependent methyltransferase, partial [candidate division WOR-3 bacterium]|nr:class I SAM-dependent methyltransferase [candidate division WOR-3 bacterium]